MLKLAIITFIAGAAAIIYARRERSIEQNAAFDKDQPHSSHKDVRDAGPQAMRDKPQREWTETLAKSADLIKVEFLNKNKR
mgnify:CR=1 FL=1